METVTEYPNWFAETAEANFGTHLGPLIDLRCLQIGVFTGDASMWLLDHVAASLVDVDTWQGSSEPAHAEFDWTDVERVYDERTEHARDGERLVKCKVTSEWFFAGTDATFDFIYIDGAHDSYSALNDAVGAYRLLKVGGLLAFDDYTWPTVGPAVDAFAYLYGDRLELVESNSQAWFRRVR